MGKAIIACSILWHLLESDVEDNKIKTPGSRPRCEHRTSWTLYPLCQLLVSSVPNPMCGGTLRLKEWLLWSNWQ